MRTIFEQTGGSYTQVGDYQIPDLILPENEESFVIGVWGNVICTIFSSIRKSAIPTCSQRGG